ncbi:hypothetical protein GN244_ATG09495 [Phytophthora infestans]|uniref:Uncharacterized protein n=1 Tax=Phytophthora infestans TaxID=4787 RepID=A0A833T7R0_PHYIN|nr:hypothetical protein GN244_ATG09495 [Phytophthora infestans]
MVGPTCNAIDPLSAEPAAVYDGPRALRLLPGSCSTATHSVQSAGGTSCGAVLPARTAQKRLSFGRKSPHHLIRPKVRRQESLANVKKAMGPDWYLKKKNRHSRPRKLTARNVRYIEQ